MSIRIVVCDPLHDGCSEACRSLEGDGLELISCEDGERLLEAVIGHPPDVVVYCLRSDIDVDLAVLHLLRRVMPDTPLILLAREGDLETRKAVQSLRPLFYAVAPIDPDELREVVHSVFARQRKRAAGE
jgi:DNA-binding NarL/FixJ family response regulator